MAVDSVQAIENILCELQRITVSHERELKEVGAQLKDVYLSAQKGINGEIMNACDLALREQIESGDMDDFKVAGQSAGGMNFEPQISPSDSFECDGKANLDQENGHGPEVMASISQDTRRKMGCIDSMTDGEGVGFHDFFNVQWEKDKVDEAGQEQQKKQKRTWSEHG